jgi:hypothetical protein
MSVVAVVLAYDDLPPGSDIRRESRDGGVTIIIPAGDVPDAIKRRLAYATLPVAAALTTASLAMLIAVLWTRLRTLRLIGYEWPIAWGLAIVVTAALLALIWRVLTTARIDAMRIARRQTTILDINAHRILLEETGPLRTASHSFELNSSVRIRIVPRLDDGALLPVIEVQHKSDPPLLLARGRENYELQWIVRTIHALTPRQLC